MRSFYGTQTPTSLNSIRAEQKLSLKWMQSYGLSSYSWYPPGISKLFGVGGAKRKGSIELCNCHLISFYERKRKIDSLKGNMARTRVTGRGWVLPPLNYNICQLRAHASHSSEGPSCIFVGPLETAEKARLEALYQQARDSYYSGSPLIVDDMFDRVEMRLRWHGSKLVLKYPRCSLKRYSVYSDAEIDSSQMLALASVWSILLASGLLAASFPPACAINKACQTAIHLHMDSHNSSSISETMMAMNGALAVGMGLVIGIPVAIAAARSLQGLWRGDLMALKGCCPNCGEECKLHCVLTLPLQMQF